VPTTTGPPQEIIALSDTNRKVTSGPPQEIIALSDTNPTLVSGPPQEIITDSDLLPIPVIGGRPNLRPRGHFRNRRFTLPGPISEI
jgi:hypothetical protein